MNLLIVSRGVRPISSSLAGGAEFVLLNHARSLARLGHRVHMISDSEGIMPEDDSYIIHQVGTPLWFGNFCRRAGFSLWIILHLIGNMLAAWSALRIIRNSGEPFDVIYCHGNLSGLHTCRENGRVQAFAVSQVSPLPGCRERRPYSAVSFYNHES